MNHCEICGETAYGQPNMEVTLVSERKNNDGSVSKQFFHPLLEPEAPPLCYLHSKMEQGILDPITTESAWIAWKKEREWKQSAFSPSGSMRRLEKILEGIRARGAKTLHDDENSQSFGFQA